MIEIVIHHPIGSGKTTKLAEMVKANDGILLVMSEGMAHNFRGSFGLREDQVMSISDRRLLGSEYSNKPKYIDTVDQIIEHVLRIKNVKGIALDSSEKLTPETRTKYWETSIANT